MKKILNATVQPDPRPRSIMAIDASTNSMAFAIFVDGDLSKFGKISFAGATTYDKVLDACKKTSAFIEHYDVDAIVIEHTVFVNSPKTAADLALVQGSLLGAAGLSGVTKIRSVAPITWQNFIGNKKASIEEKLEIKKNNPGKSDSWYKNYERQERKNKTIRYISVQYNKTVTDNDVSDAIGIGHYAINAWERLTR